MACKGYGIRERMEKTIHKIARNCWRTDRFGEIQQKRTDDARYATMKVELLHFLRQCSFHRDNYHFLSSFPTLIVVEFSWIQV